VFHAFTQAIRNTIPNNAKKEKKKKKKRIIITPPLRFQEYQLVVNCGKKETDMEKHPYDQLIETVADKMKEHKDDNLGFGIFEKVDKELGLGRGTAWDASG
jgi:hypothetical protein